MFLNISHYSFFKIKDTVAAQQSFRQTFAPTDVLGTILIAPEGINLNLAGSEGQLRENLSAVLKGLGCQEFQFKESFSATRPFEKLKIRLKKEIVTLGKPELDVNAWRAPHMKSQELAEMIEKNEEFLLLDTRNQFETEMGTFAGAHPAGTQHFRQFPDTVAQLPKDKKLVMFCTGGIRCEKASAYLRSEGFQNVYQLDGGILRYFEEQGTKHWQGKCFVFDERISLAGEEDLNLDPEK